MAQKSEQIVFEGWLEKKSRHLGSWRKRWIVLTADTLKSFKTENKANRTELIDLGIYDSCCRDGSLQFKIYKGSKASFTFRGTSAKEAGAWIENISAGIQRAKSCKHISIGMISNTVMTKARFNVHDGKVAVLLYDKVPNEYNDMLIKVDMVCVQNGTGITKKCIRVRASKVIFDEINQFERCEEKSINKSEEEIRRFCVDYQIANPGYRYGFNNYLPFITQFCTFLHIDPPDFECREICHEPGGGKSSFLSSFASTSTANFNQEDYIHEIDEEFSNDQLLKCRFVKGQNSHHPELLIYNKYPEKSHHVVTRIDLICVDGEDGGKKENRVRMQCVTWGKLPKRTDDPREYPVLKSFPEITQHIVEYQEKNPYYDVKTNNCRKFIIDLCDFLCLKFPDAWFCEELWYSANAACASNGNEGKKMQIESQNEQDKKEEEIKKLKEKLNKMDGKDSGDAEEDVKDGIHDAEEVKEEKIDVEAMWDKLYENKNIQQYSGKYFESELYEKLKDAGKCFIEINNGYSSMNYGIYYNLILVKSDDDNSENDRYFSYPLEVSYEILSVIEDTMNRMNETKEQKFHGKSDKAKKFTADVWLDMEMRPPLLPPSAFDGGEAKYYGTYLQVLCCYTGKAAEYIHTALKLPQDLSVLINLIQSK